MADHATRPGREIVEAGESPVSGSDTVGDGRVGRDDCCRNGVWGSGMSEL